MVREGKTAREIERELDISHARVYQLIARARRLGEID